VSQQEIRPSQIRALLWLIVLVPLIPTGLMLRFMLGTVQMERAAAFERLSAIYQQTLDKAEENFFLRHLPNLRELTPRSAHKYFRDLLDRDVVVRVVDENWEPLTGITVSSSTPDGKPVAEVTLRGTPGPWTVQVYLVDDKTLLRSAQEQFTTYVIVTLVTVVLIIAIAVSAAVTVSRQITLRELRTTAVATVAHELRTPLASMRMLVDTLREGRIRDDGQTREYLDLIAKENERLSKLAEDFLTFSRLDRGKHQLNLEPISPRVVVDQAIAGLRPRLEAPGCTFTCDVASDLPPIRANRDALAAVLANLLENALKYTKEEKQIALWARAAKDAVVFAVTDNGIGIERAHLRGIFRPFHQVDDRLSRQGEGAGLGLAIVSRMVAAHRGKLHVDSQPGQGTTFSVRIPLAS
jgi:signal transduction histidine kinase